MDQGSRGPLLIHITKLFALIRNPIRYSWYDQHNAGQMEEIQMLPSRKLRKVQGRSNALMTVYECDSCLWIVNVPYEKKLPEVQLKYDIHDCGEKPLRQRSAEPGR